MVPFPAHKGTRKGEAFLDSQGGRVGKTNLEKSLTGNNPLTQDPRCCLHETEEVHQRCFSRGFEEATSSTKALVIGAPSVRLVSLVGALCDPVAQGLSHASICCDIARQPRGPMDTMTTI